MTKRVGILCGGGDAPGLNAVIRAFTRRAGLSLGWTVLGIEDSFDGLLEEPKRVRTLGRNDVKGILHLGGTILGTTNRGDPFSYPVGGERRDVSADVAAAVQELDLQGLVVIGGDGTQKIGWKLMQATGVPVVGVPKTIDNDLAGTDRTFGFQSAIDVATEAIDRLATTAEAHRRVMVLEVMGRDSGHIALHAGLSGGADVILLPELPYDASRVAKRIQRRHGKGRLFTIIVVAEGALPADPGGVSPSLEERKRRLKEGNGAANILIAQLHGQVEAEMRATVLGHLQRGGSPVPSDRLLAQRFGAHAATLVEQGRWGELVCLRDDEVTSVPLADAAKTRFVNLDGAMAKLARQLDVELGG
ncbi:MAG: 6-phosphofructokinase [Myxococcota bacterium]